MSARVLGRLPAARAPRADRGQAVILIAAAAPVLFAMLALLVDLGFSYTLREKVRTAADAAALAAVRALSGNGTDSAIRSAAESYAGQNGATVDTANGATFYVDQSGANLGAVGGGTVPSGAMGVEVRAKTTVKTFFGGIVGRSLVPIGVSSRAMVTPGDVVPFGVPYLAGGYQENVTYWVEGKWDSKTQKGVNWPYYGSDANDTGVLNLRGGSTNTQILIADIQGGYPGAVRVDDVIPQASQADNAVKVAVPARLQAGNHLVILPIVLVTTVKDGNSPRKKVVGFGLFSLDTPYNRDPNYAGTNTQGVYLGFLESATGFKMAKPSTLP